MGHINTAWIEITEKCNLHCKYCYMDANSGFHQYTIEEYRNILDLLKELQVTYVVISGGEPCLHYSIEEYINMACKEGFKVGVATNGTCITDSLISCFIKNDVFLQISIDSIECDDFAQSRGANKLDVVVSNLTHLVDLKIPVTLSCTLTDINSKCVIEICDLAKKLGIPFIHFGPLIPTKRCLTTGVKFTNLFDPLRTLYEYQIANYLDLQIDIIEEFINIIANPNESNSQSIYYCEAMAGHNIQIDSCGNVFQCGLIDNTEPFNLFKAVHTYHLSMPEIAQKCTQILRPISAIDIPSCKKCKCLQLCRGGCRACAYNTTGNVYSCLPYCNDIQNFVNFLEKEHASGRLDNYISFLKLMRIVEEKQYGTHVKRMGIY